MFGFQRIGDLIGRPRYARHVTVGCSGGRTTLAAKAYSTTTPQHVLASPVPSSGYDPAFAYEIGIIIQDGIKRMYR